MRPLQPAAVAPKLLVILAVLAAGCAHHAPPEVAAAPAPPPTASKHSTAWEDSVTLAKMAADAKAAEAARARDLANEQAMLTKMTFFGYDRALLSDSDRALLDAKLAILQAHPSLKIQIDGNCDDRGSDEYNLALGENRAASAKRYLVEHGIAADRIEILSYGKEHPVAAGTDDVSRAQNRNDQFVILSGAESLGEAKH